jgi:hypothetical protein
MIERLLHLQHKPQVVLVSYPESVISGVSCELERLGGATQATEKQAAYAFPLRFATFHCIDAPRDIAILVGN